MASGQFAIIGQGSIAAVSGWLLQSAGEGFYSFNRKGLAAWAYRFDVAGHQQHVTALDPAADRAALSSVRTVLVCVKAYDLWSSCAHLSAFTHPVTVLPFVNGYTDDILAKAAAQFPRHVIRQAVATVGVSRTDDAFSLRSRGGRLQFGPFGAGKEQAKESASEQTLAMLRRDLSLAPVAPVFEWRDDVQRLCRRKWLFNTTVNTLTAARRLPRNGDLLADLSTLAAVFAEACGLAERLWGELPAARAEGYAALLKLIEDTADNENSMAADVRLGRRTENAVLAGLSARYPGEFPLLESMAGFLQS